MREPGVGTAMNTLANEEDDENTTGVSSNQQQEEAHRQIQIAQLNTQLLQ